MTKKEYIEGVDFYLQNGLVVLTEKFHIDRGFCCGKSCFNCPYEYQIKGYTILKNNSKQNEENI